MGSQSSHVLQWERVGWLEVRRETRQVEHRTYGYQNDRERKRTRLMYVDVCFEKNIIEFKKTKFFDKQKEMKEIG